MAEPHQPPYVYTPNQGYEMSEPVPASLASRRNDEVEYDDEYDDEYDERLDDILDDEHYVDEEYLSYSNGGDLTQAFNRQRQQQQAKSSSEGPARTAAPRSNAQPPRPAANTKASVDDDQMSGLSRHVGKIRIDDIESWYNGDRDRDKADRATVEQVLDEQTRMILARMINHKTISAMHGAISTGKEANVYGAVLEPADGTGPTTHRAIKVYKVSSMGFKDRARYVEGDHRFKGSGAKGNSRRMVNRWAEKEFRNLRRLHAAGIACPEPIKLELNVLVMEFLGDRKGRAYPRLRDAPIAGDDVDHVDELWRALYVQLLGIMRRLYQVCRLVHADLSEYNILYNDKKLFIIDVSQSVEPHHPRSLEFLRMDIKNVGNYFRRQGVDTLSDRVIFEFIVASEPPVQEPAMSQAIEHLYKVRPMAADDDAAAAELEVDNLVFRNQYIPQTLADVCDFEKDGQHLASGGGDQLVYKSLLADHVVAPKTKGKPEQGADGETGSTDDDNDVDNSSIARTRGHRFEDKDEKRARKAAVKEAQREKRKDKIPKSLKKHMVAMTSSKSNKKSSKRK